VVGLAGQFHGRGWRSPSGDNRVKTKCSTTLPKTDDELVAEMSLMSSI
jgi:hypothetical protein